MTHSLDTDTCIGVVRQRPGMVQRLSQVAPTDCAVSMVTVYELFCGVEKAQDQAKERQKVQRFVSAIVELPLDRAAAETAARIRGDLERQGQLIGPYDLLIADLGFAGRQGQRKSLCAEFCTAVEGAEKLFEPGQQGLTVTLDGRVGEFAEVFDLADQVSQAELDEHAALAGVFAIGPPKVSPQAALEVLT
jgi:tRNA(fMet)-specific endonuclease VapC